MMLYFRNNGRLCKTIHGLAAGHALPQKAAFTAERTTVTFFGDDSCFPAWFSPFLRKGTSLTFAALSELHGGTPMNNILRKTAMASALAIAAMAFSNMSMAQDTQQNTHMRKCIGDNCPGQGMNNGNGQAMPNDNDQNMPTRKLRKKNMQPNDQAQDLQNGEDQSGGNGQLIKLRKKGTMTNEQVQENNGNDQMIPRKKMRQANWQFDASRHHRRHHRDVNFRFFYEGYWYDRPYWEENYYVDSGYGGYGISCREGRNIVSERFDRVRVVECSGRTYTYIGHRHGGSFEVVLNSRSGRIIDVNEI